MCNDELSGGRSAIWSRPFSYLVSAGLGPRLIRSVAGGAALYVAGMVVTFFVGVMLARGLGTSGYGAYGIAMAVAALAGVIAEIGMSKLVVREVAVASTAEPPTGVRPILWWADRNCLLLSLAVTLVIAAVALALVDPASAVQKALLWSCPYVAFVAFANLRSSALRGLHFVTLGQAPALLLRPLFFALILFAYFNVTSDPSAGDAMAMHALAALLVFGVADIWLRSRLPMGGSSAPPEAHRSWIAATLPMAMAEGLKVLHGHIGVLLLGILSTESETGLFRVAVSIYVVVATPISLLNVILAPLFTQLHTQGDRRRLRRTSFASAWAAAIGSLLLTLPLLVFGRPLLSWVFGREYEPALPAILILCAGVVISAALGQSATLLSMTGHERKVSKAMTFALVINLLLITLLVPRWESVGAALAMAGSFILWNFLTLLDARRMLGIDTSVAGWRRVDD